MERINKVCFILFTIIIFFTIGYYFGSKNNNIDYNDIVLYDTTYNKIVLDSIKYNIKIKDSVIIKLKDKIKYEMEQAINANDSVAVEQFKSLAGAN